MGARADLICREAMTTRWRRRQMCVLVADGERPAAMRTISALGAFVETDARPELGAAVLLRHPDAGTICAHVQAHHRDGLSVRFDAGETAVAFALSAIAADMSRPA